MQKTSDRDLSVSMETGLLHSMQVSLYVDLSSMQETCRRHAIETDKSLLRLVFCILCRSVSMKTGLHRDLSSA